MFSTIVLPILLFNKGPELKSQIHRFRLTKQKNRIILLKQEGIVTLAPSLPPFISQILS